MKHAIGLFAMVSGKSFPQTSGLKCQSRLANAVKGQLLGKNMSRFGYNPDWTIRITGRIMQGDAASIAMPDQNGLLNAACRQYIPQDNFRLPAKRVPASGFQKRIRTAGSIPVIYQSRKADRFSQQFREFTPYFDAAETLMQKNQDRRPLQTFPGRNYGSHPQPMAGGLKVKRADRWGEISAADSSQSILRQRV
jgi:choline dehydrogenase-like flavoprotein